MTMSPGAVRLNEYVRANRPKSIDPADMRAWFLDLVKVTPIPEDAKLELSSCPASASWIRPSSSATDRVILYVHGGAYLLGSSRTHLELTYRLAKNAGTIALSSDYRLLPEHPYPACVDDVVETYRYLLKEGFSPQHIAIAGDSAGGGITLTTALRLRNDGLPPPACLLCISPWTDLTGSGETLVTNARYDSMIDTSRLPFLAQLLLLGRDARAHSPLFADLHNLPPLFLQAGTAEVLFDDSRRLAERYAEAGNKVIFDPWTGMTHVFQAFPTFALEAIEATEKAASFIREHLR